MPHATTDNKPSHESRAPFHSQRPVAPAPGFLLGCLLTLSCACVAPVAVAAEPAAAKADPKAAQFETLAQAVTQNPAAAGEQQIVELVTLARDLGRPYAANIAIKTWLARTQSPSPAADARKIVGLVRESPPRAAR